MQIIKHEFGDINPIFAEFDKVYSYLSERRKSLITPVFDEAFKPLFEMFSQNGYEFSAEYAQKPRIPLKLPRKRKKTIIVCFSGGKDSIAAVKRFQEQGYKVFLYHLEGINQTYRDEHENARKAADFLRLPIHFEKVQLKGSHEYTEHPMKNMIIANGALQYGIRENIGTNIAFGNYTTSSLSDDRFDICGGDDCEMWEVYEEIIAEFISGFKVQRVLENINETLTVFTENQELIPYAQSCIGPYRYRKYLHDNNEKKYGIKLAENKCGSCWKCCLEYCVFTDKGILEYNAEYYKHCMQILQKTLKQETQVKHTLEEVWEHFFFYDMKESKLYGKRWNK